MDYRIKILKQFDVPDWLIDNLTDLDDEEFVVWLSDNITRLYQISLEFQDIASRFYKDFYNIDNYLCLHNFIED